MKVLVDIDLDFLKPFQIKAERKVKAVSKEKTVSIYKTTQGTQKNEGINIDINLPRFRNYANVDLYVLGDLMFIIPQQEYTADTYRVSMNRDNSSIVTIKVGSEKNVKRLESFTGKYTIEDVEDGNSAAIMIRRYRKERQIHLP